MEELKFCRKCNAWKPISEFYKDTRGGCRACVRKYQNAWSTAHRVHKRPVIPEGMRLCKRCGELKSQDEFYKDHTNVSGYHHYCKMCTDSARKERREKAKKLKEKIPEGLKRCCHCKQVYPLNNFYFLKTKGIYKPKCKACEKEYRETHRAQRNAAEKKRLSKPEVRSARLAYKKEWREQPKIKTKETSYRKKYQQREEVKDRNRKHNAKWRDTPEHRAEAVQRAAEWVKAHPEESKQHRRNRYARMKGADGSYDKIQWDKLLELCGHACVFCGETENITRDHIIPLAWGGSNWIENIQPMCRKHNSKKKALFAADYRPLPARAWAYEQTYGTLDEEFDEQATLEWWVKLQALGMGVETR